MSNNFVIQSDELKDVCGKILTAVDNSEVSLVTETLEMVAKNKVFIINVTNREYFVEVYMPMENDDEFHATVNASLFLKLVAQITTPTIELYVKDNTLMVIGNGTYKLPLIFDGAKLLELPKIKIENVTTTFGISSDILSSILQYNSKELQKGVISRPIQKMYYVDQNGAITFTSGACVNYFSLEQPIKVLFNNRLVKLFKLFKEGIVKFTLGHNVISEDITQTCVMFEGDNVVITAVLSCDDSLLNSVPVKAICDRASKIYPYNVVLDKNALVQTINRLTIFNKGMNTIAKTYGIFEFDKDSVTIYDANKENKEVIKYANDTSNVDSVYSMYLNLDDLKVTLDSCIESHLNIGFGDGSALVVSRGKVKNVIPEVRLA